MRKARLRLVRRFGPLPGLTKKLSRKTNTPGQHGQPKEKVLRKMSAYGLRLLEKQKLRFNYTINERQFIRYVKQAKKSKGSTGDILLRLLEMRLDNIVYRLGMAPTILAARQLVGHGHILVNQQKRTIPSYSCQLKDIISVKSKKGSRELVQRFVDLSSQKVPYHLSFNRENLVGVINQWANQKEMGFSANELLVIEYYSRS